jgi:hypothetical protein
MVDISTVITDIAIDITMAISTIVNSTANTIAHIEAITATGIIITLARITAHRPGTFKACTFITTWA